MPVTSQLKRGVDIPVFEWLRNMPNVTNGLSVLTGGYDRYLYYQFNSSTTFTRYDTYSDSWAFLSPSPLGLTTIGSSTFNKKHGFHGRIIASVSSTETRLALPYGGKSIGKKIRIVNGTGAGQVRTITAVSDPTIHDTLVSTGSASTIFLTDSNKSYAFNQYRDYGLRLIGNSQYNDFRRILFSDTNTLYLADHRHSTLGVKWSYAPLLTNTSNTSGSQSLAQIESYVITVDSAWSTSPDNTSEFVIESGGLWNMNVNVARWGWQYYDVLADTWYIKSSCSGGLMTGNLATDGIVQSIKEFETGILSTGTVSSATYNTATVSTTYTANQYTNYIIRITGGTGIGQYRLIKSHTTNIITVSKAWSTQPDNTSTFEIVANNNRSLMIGNAGSSTFEYNADADFWSDRIILEDGVASNLCAVWNGYRRPVTISSITRTGTTATVTTVNPHGLKTGDTVTIYGASDALYNIATAITATGSNAFTYTLASTPAANAVAANALSATLLVDPSKNWQVNEHVGKMVTFMGTYAQSTGYNASYTTRLITANTATTLTFANIGSPTAAGPYVITGSEFLGTVFNSAVASGSTTSVINTVTTGMATNTYAGRRALIVDGANWAEALIASNTGSSISLTAALGFTPSTNALIGIHGIQATGTGLQLNYLANTSTVQKGKYMFAMRGNNTNNIMLYNITTNQWEVIGQHTIGETFTTGTMSDYDGQDRIYIQRDTSGRILYYDMTDSNIYNAGVVPYGMSTSTNGNKLVIASSEDGVKFLYIPRHSSNDFWRFLIWT
jgi:hypothetical protein